MSSYQKCEEHYIESVARPRLGQFAENLLECAQGGNVPFDICLRMIMEDLRTQMTIGFPEFGIGPTEPLSIRNLKFLSKPQLSGAVSVNAEFTNVSNCLTLLQKCSKLVLLCRRPGLANFFGKVGQPTEGNLAKGYTTLQFMMEQRF